ncbi:MAG: hypothetical protein Q7S48_00870 [bacterium]|nr:hypothetical protein [bacterium]
MDRKDESSMDFVGASLDENQIGTSKVRIDPSAVVELTVNYAQHFARPDYWPEYFPPLARVWDHHPCGSDLGQQQVKLALGEVSVVQHDDVHKTLCADIASSPACAEEARAFLEHMIQVVAALPLDMESPFFQPVVVLGTKFEDRDKSLYVLSIDPGRRTPSLRDEPVRQPTIWPRWVRLTLGDYEVSKTPKKWWHLVCLNMPDKNA